jgi:hypothetical protein
MLRDVEPLGDRNVIKEEAQNIRKYKDLTIKITTHVKCESSSHTGNNMGDWKYLKIFRKKREQLIGKVRHQETTEYSHTGHRTHTLQSTDVKEGNIRHGK